MENNCDACQKSFEVVSLRRMVVSDGQTHRYCSGCVYGSTSANPDVYYGYGSGTHYEENIAYPNGHPQAGQPIPFSSKREKALAMKMAGVRECGDKVKGMRRDDMVGSNRKKYFI
jgi:hypothetical protein